MNLKAYIMKYLSLDDAIKAETRDRRYAGGKQEALSALFNRKKVKLIQYVRENDYTGNEGALFKFPNGSFAFVTDYFGSCGGCDSWENASDDNARSLLVSCATSARVFKDAQEVLKFIEECANDADQYSHRYIVLLDKSKII